MKKQLLLILSVIPAYLFAQQSTPISNPIASVPHPVLAGQVASDNQTGAFFASSSSPKLFKKHPGYSAILIGKTYYDLQTNASVGRRIILHDDGTISAVWTTSAVSTKDWPERGTGYNHKTTSWLAPVSARLEAERAGWPCLGVLNNAGTKYEITMGHVSTTGGWVVSKNNAIGSTNFTKLNTSLLQLNNKVAIWGRIGTDNKKMIHHLSNYFSDAAGGIPVVTLKGVTSPTTYSRSTDGGVTWDKQFLTLPGYDSSRVVSGGGDNYAIDVKDSIVAIVTGGTGEDITIYKSTDNGNNFTKIDAEPFQFSPFTKVFIANADREKTTDGSMDVIIGNDNKVHVFFGRTFVSDEDITDDSYSFYPGTAQLMHWCEGMDTAVVCGVAKDYDGDGAVTVTQETTYSLDGSGNLPSGVTSATRYGGTALVSFPSSSIDANGNLYVVYSAPHELAISPFNANYRDLYVSFSTDNGLTWTVGQNITANAFGILSNRENVFASAAKRSDNFLHLIYQEDDLPGTNLQNNGNSNAHPNIEQFIQYRAIPLQDILNNKLGDVASVRRVTNDPKIFFVSQNQPNPATSETQAYLYMRDGSEITLTVSDITGKVIKTEELGYFAAGNNAITINVDGLDSGLYLYTLANKQYTITKKMMVK